MKRMIPPQETLPPNPKYPRNESGETYGSRAGNSPFEKGPDLIKAEGVNGVIGYVRYTELNGEEPKTPEEALALQAKGTAGRVVNLYESDGKTIIDKFFIGKGSGGRSKNIRRYDPMDIEIQLISVEQKSVLVQLMELYNYDFSEYEDININEYGYYGYSHIDDYWNEDGRFPYFIRVDGKLAGFVLVNGHCRYISGPDAHSMAEFFVMRKYRRKGIGSYAAKETFDRHRGQWEVLQISNNVRAQRFWKSVISEYTGGMYKECGSIEEERVGFLFNNFESL